MLRDLIHEAGGYIAKVFKRDVTWQNVNLREQKEKRGKHHLFVEAQCTPLLFIYSSERNSFTFHICHPVAEYFISVDIKMRSCLAPHRESQCAPTGILKSGEKSKRHRRDMVKRAKQPAVFEREMKVKNQESGDKSRRGLKGGSVGVNGPCP